MATIKGQRLKDALDEWCDQTPCGTCELVKYCEDMFSIAEIASRDKRR